MIYKTKSNYESATIETLTDRLEHLVSIAKSERYLRLSAIERECIDNEIMIVNSYLDLLHKIEQN